MIYSSVILVFVLCFLKHRSVKLCYGIFSQFSNYYSFFSSCFHSPSVWNPVFICGGQAGALSLLDPGSVWDRCWTFLWILVLRVLGLRWLQIHRHVVSRSALHVWGNQLPAYIFAYYTIPPVGHIGSNGDALGGLWSVQDLIFTQPCHIFEAKSPHSVNRIPYHHSNF